MEQKFVKSWKDVKRTTADDGVKFKYSMGSWRLYALRSYKPKYGGSTAWSESWAKYRRGIRDAKIPTWVPVDEYQEKAWPVAVNLGDSKTAIPLLISMLKEMGCEVEVKGKETKPGLLDGEVKPGLLGDVNSFSLEDYDYGDVSGDVSGKSFAGADVWAKANEKWVDEGGLPF